MSFFNQNSHFQKLVQKASENAGRGQGVTDERIGVVAKDLLGSRISTKKAPAVSTEQLEDWSYRLGSAANEAQDEGLGALESDLLDLRDEIAFVLHDSL